MVFPSLRALLLVGITAAGIPASAAAQSTRIDTQAAAEALARLHPESVLRIDAQGGRRVQGRFDGLSQASIRVSFDGSGESVDLDQLTAVWVRGRHTKTGAIVGGVGGLGLGLFIGYVANALCETGDCGRAYLLAPALFIPAGALVGAAIGAAIPNWRRIIP
jgi:hypothetical protein